MTDGDAWREAVAPLKLALEQGRDIRHCREVRQLVALATELGLSILRKRYRDLDDDTQRALIQDCVATKLEYIVGGTTPRALFRRVLSNRAIDEVRRRKRQADVTEPEEMAKASALHADDGDLDFVLDARVALAALPRHVREIATAVALGEERDELARAYGYKDRNAIDQIVRRVRRAWKEAE